MRNTYFAFFKRADRSTVSPTILAAVIAVVTTVLPLTSNAEYLGLIAGRGANPGGMTNSSLELGFVTGDLGTADYQNIAVRYNYRVLPDLVVSATAGIAEFGRTDGVPFGLGLTYHLANQRISQKVEIAGRASYHTGSFSVGNVDGDLSSLVLEVLVSGVQPLASNGLGWYSNFGVHRLSVDFGQSDSNSELGLGAGLVLPTGLGEAYFGLDFIDELTIGLGIRYFISNS